MCPCHSFLYREGVLGIGHLQCEKKKWLSCFADVYLFAVSASYAMDDIGGGAHEVISDLNGSLGSRYFLGIVNERTGFASYASAFKSARLFISLEGTFDQKIAYVIVAFE